MNLEIEKEEIFAFFEKIKSKKVLIIGDLMIDRYLWGNADRISPEAPVPIIDVKKSESRLGGAANVAMNILKMGATPILCGTIGTDSEHLTFIEIMEKHGFSTNCVIKTQTKRTTRKVRVIAQYQQVLRVDIEDKEYLSEKVENELFEKIETELPKADIVIFEDYDKGLLSPNLIQKITEKANELGKITVVDPKFKQFFAYNNCTLFKPNLKELRDALKIPLKKNSISSIQSAVLNLRKKMPHEMTLVTLSENGVLVCNSEGKFTHFDAFHRNIVDVSGAGDTVISVMALAMSAGISVEKSSWLANLAGGLVCEEVGVVPISNKKLLSEALEKL